MFMKRRIKLGKEIELIGQNRYSIFYDTKNLCELYCFLFDSGTYQIETELQEIYTGKREADEFFSEVLAKHDFILV